MSEAALSARVRHAQCHCGAVRIAIAGPITHLNDCNCTLCTSHGMVCAYAAPEHVVVTGETSAYVRADHALPAISLHFCGRCGSTTHWTLTDAFRAAHVEIGRMGINARLMAAVDLAGLELRFPDGLAWNGPEPVTFRRPAVVLDETGLR